MPIFLFCIVEEIYKRNLIGGYKMIIKFNKAMTEEIKKLFNKRRCNNKDPYKLNSVADDNINDYCLLLKLLQQTNNDLLNK